jgi:hypothetical protein
MGNTMKRLTVLRPKNRDRVNANAASVPSTNASAVAVRPVCTEWINAVRGPSSCSAFCHQWRVKPVGGHA